MRLFFLILFVISSCKKQDKPKYCSNYPEEVGDILFDKSIDDINFQLCDRTQVLQYYNFLDDLYYKEGKSKIDYFFYSNFSNKKILGQSGYITFRFVVNCKGDIGRVRIESMNRDYKKYDFKEEITLELFSLVKKLDSWSSLEIEGKPYDYYQYITFKILDGQIKAITP